MIDFHLNVAVLPILGFFEIRNNSNGEVTVTGGLEEAFLKMFALHLGFTYTINVPDDLEWGTQHSDGSWSGLVGMIQRGEADMAVSRMSLLENRMSIVHYSYPYYFEAFKFAKQFPEELPTTTAFLRPFSKNLWLSFFVCLSLMTIAFRFLLKIKHPLTTLALKVFGTFLNQSTGMEIDLLRERFLVLPFYITTFCITSCYMSMLLSFLTLPLMADDIRNTEQLARAVKSGTAHCAFFKGYYTLSYFVESNNGAVRTIGESLREETSIEPSRESVANFIRKEKGVLLAPEEDIKRLIDDVFLPDEKIFSMLSAVAVSKSFRWKENLDDTIHRIWSSGLYAKSVKDFLPRVKTSSETVAAPKQLKMKDLIGVSYLLFGGLFVSAIVFFVELGSPYVKIKDWKIGFIEN